MIYFIQQGKKGPIKIGKANDPILRLKEKIMKPQREVNQSTCVWHTQKEFGTGWTVYLTDETGREWVCTFPEKPEQQDVNTALEGGWFVLL